jgi:hypothetical protein
MAQRSAFSAVQAIKSVKFFRRFSLNDRTALRDRSALLPTHSGRASPYLAHSQQYSNRTADELESQNDEEIEGLSAKVKMLKDVCHGTILSYVVSGMGSST